MKRRLHKRRQVRVAVRGVEVSHTGAMQAQNCLQQGSSSGVDRPCLIWLSFVPIWPGRSTRTSFVFTNWNLIRPVEQQTGWRKNVCRIKTIFFCSLVEEKLRVTSNKTKIIFIFCFWWIVKTIQQSATKHRGYISLKIKKVKQLLFPRVFQNASHIRVITFRKIGTSTQDKFQHDDVTSHAAVCMDWLYEGSKPCHRYGRGYPVVRKIS